jgi:Tfp pilus assembly PilM family ATPase
VSGGWLRPPRPGRGVARARQWLARALLEPEYPAVAVEVRPGAVAAVRLTREGGRLALGAAGLVELAPGTLEASLTQPNVRDRAAFEGALRTALERSGGLEGGPVSLVLPDSAVRLALVSSDGLRGRRKEAEDLIRFRLHKALPFDVRAARVAWEPARGEQTMVAVALETVVQEYEEILEGLGFHPGLVEVSSLALASLAGEGPAEGDRLLVNWDVGYVSFLLLRGGEPLMVRTLPGESEPLAVARQATSTLQFYRDRLGGGPLGDAVVRSAERPIEEALEALTPALGRRPRPVEPWAALGAAEADPSAHAVAGAAASALRRAA